MKSLQFSFVRSIPAGVEGEERRGYHNQYWEIFRLKRDGKKKLKDRFRLDIWKKLAVRVVRHWSSAEEET